MKKQILLVIFVLFPFYALSQYFEPLSNEDLILQSIYTGITVIDWMQTKEFVAEGSKEKNPILGKTPSQKEVDILILSAIASHAFIVYMLPKRYRRVWQFLFVAIEFDAICHNFRLGRINEIVIICDSYSVGFFLEF